MNVSTKDLKYLCFCHFGGKIFSTCAKRQYMAIILSKSGRTIGTGYNGSPPGQPHCVDGHCPRLHQDSASGSSYDNCIAIHAEQNALMWSDRTAREGGTLYVNGPPCFTCAKLIASSGLSRVVCIQDSNYVQWPEVLEFLERVGIIVDEVHPDDVVHFYAYTGFPS